jgi:hypothetical protein
MQRTCQAYFQSKGLDIKPLKNIVITTVWQAAKKVAKIATREIPEHF